MCRYNYSNGKCANIDVDASFCVGESNCSLLNFLGTRSLIELPERNSWQEIPLGIWAMGKNGGKKS